MAAFAPLLLIAFILEALYESFVILAEMIKTKVIVWPRVATAVMGTLILAGTSTNLFLLAGVPNADASNFIWDLSYITGGLLLMRGSGG